LKVVRHMAVAAAFSSLLCAQATGPDVIVGDLIDVAAYGSGTPVGGVPSAAFAIGTTSCNLGTAELAWFAGTNNKPVIGQSVFRLKGGRFEQVGFGWLKHGFFALAENACASCQVPSNFGNYLGINCSDPYTAGLNGDQGNIGPRFEVNPYTGFYPMPYTLTPSIANNPATPANETNVLSGRLLIAHDDLDPAMNVGASYVAEGVYVHPGDAAAGNGFNNASYRPISFFPNGASYGSNLTGSIVRQKPAIYAWNAADPSVIVKDVDVPGEGRFVVGYKATSLGGGLWRHEYAVYNQNSDRAGGSFSVSLPAGVSATPPADHFRDVGYHSGEPQGGTDWALTNAPGSAIAWACTTPAPSNAANALRWGTLYNFRFDANIDWLPFASIGLFNPGTPSSVAVGLCREAGLPTVVSGGPTWSAVPFDYVDASSGSPGPAGNDVGATVALPFAFNFLGTTINQIVISTNGYLAVPGQFGVFSNNSALPNGILPNGIIAAYWDDLEIGNVGAGGAATGWCRYLTVGTAPNRRFVVEWRDAQRWLSNNSFTFEAILHEGSNDITITHLNTPSGANGFSATRGVENAAGDFGLQITFNQQNVTANSSVRIVNAPFLYSDTALLTFGGDGSTAAPFRWTVVSDPNVALTLFGDFAPGPVLVPGLQGWVGLGLTSNLFAVADGSGIFGAFNPLTTAATDACNEWTFSLAFGPTPIPPSAADVYFQAIVWTPLAPNGFARTSTTVNF
jgi:hypothetical protein